MGSVCSVGIDVLPQMARIDTDVRVRRNLTRIERIREIRTIRGRKRNGWDINEHELRE